MAQLDSVAEQDEAVDSLKRSQEGFARFGRAQDIHFGSSAEMEVGDD